MPMVTLRAKSYIRRGQRANQPPPSRGEGQPARALWLGPILAATNYCPGTAGQPVGPKTTNIKAAEDLVQVLTA